MGYQVKFSPADENVFLMAASDNKIYQWDVRSGSVVQEYNYHLQPCNSITFFDNGRKFISTSDDKKVLVWEYDIPVPIKYIAEPDMHSIPSVTLHPSGNFFAGQSMDNTIVVYTCGEKVKQLKKRTFSGHNNSGQSRNLISLPLFLRVLTAIIIMIIICLFRQVTLAKSDSVLTDNFSLVAMDKESFSCGTGSRVKYIGSFRPMKMALQWVLFGILFFLVWLLLAAGTDLSNFGIKI
jgi:hypothetical protein